MAKRETKQEERLLVNVVNERPRQWSPAWYYVRMVELGRRTTEQLEASFCASHCAGDSQDAAAINKALTYMKNERQSNEQKRN
jgi:hypothetical protein